MRSSLESTVTVVMPCEDCEGKGYRVVVTPKTGKETALPCTECRGRGYTTTADNFPDVPDLPEPEVTP